MAPLVSVVVPTRDRAGIVPVTLRSVLAQRDVELEVVVVDDGSEDDTVAAVERLGDARIRVLRHPGPRGQSVARNAGVEAAEGRWVAFLDDDDLWAPDKLRTQLEALGHLEASWGYAGAVHFRPGPDLWSVSHPPPPAVCRARLPFVNNVPAGASNVVARRDVLAEVGGFDPALVHLSDWDMWLRLLRHGDPGVTPAYVVAYRLHASNLALTSVDGILEELAVVADRHADLRGGAPLDPTPVRDWLAVTFWRAGRRADARRMYLGTARQGDLRAFLRAARTLVPVERLRRGPEWPSGTREWLVTALATGGDR